MSCDQLRLRERPKLLSKLAAISNTSKFDRVRAELFSIAIVPARTTSDRWTYSHLDEKYPHVDKLFSLLDAMDSPLEQKAHESHPITVNQLAAEVKGIYAGLVMVEAKCINIDASQHSNLGSVLDSNQWQALIALHRTLLYEHHDFLMATQHPSATPKVLRELAARYKMPARVWKHGIHAFLRLLRLRRPESRKYMLAFTYLAYQMTALFFETVPGMTDTRIECLGDLSRYRMSTEEEIEMHTPWGGTARRWYKLAPHSHSNKHLLHHMPVVRSRSNRLKFYLNTETLMSSSCESTAGGAVRTLRKLAPHEHQPEKNSRMDLEQVVQIDRCRTFGTFAVLLQESFRQLTGLFRTSSIPRLLCVLAILASIPSVSAADIEDQIASDSVRRWYLHITALVGIMGPLLRSLSVGVTPWLQTVSGSVMFGSALWFSLLTEAARASKEGYWGCLLWLMSLGSFILICLMNRIVGMMHLLIACTITFAVLGLLRIGQGAALNAFLPLAATCSILAVVKMSESGRQTAANLRQAIHRWTADLQQ